MHSPRFGEYGIRVIFLEDVRALIGLEPNTKAAPCADIDGGVQGLKSADNLGKFIRRCLNGDQAQR